MSLARRGRAEMPSKSSYYFAYRRSSGSQHWHTALQWVSSRKLHCQDIIITRHNSSLSGLQVAHNGSGRRGRKRALTRKTQLVSGLKGLTSRLPYRHARHAAKRRNLQLPPNSPQVNTSMLLSYCVTSSQRRHLFQSLATTSARGTRNF